MPAEPLIEAQVLSTAAEILDLRERLILAQERLDGLLKSAPESLAIAIAAAMKSGSEKLERRSQPPDLHQLLILIGASPGCTTKHLAEQTYGSTDRLFTERIRGRLNHCVTACLLTKNDDQRGGGWTLTDLGRDRLKDFS